MRIPSNLLQLLDTEEINKLARLYGTDLYKPYFKQLKKKYKKLLFMTQEILDDTPPDDIA